MRTAAAAGAIILGATAVAAVTASAASAAPRCWTGSWKVTSASADLDSKDLKFKLKGGSGIKLKLAKNGKATYDFTGSRPLTGSGSVKGVPTKATLTLDKKLVLKNKISGSAKGGIVGKPKTASGDATLTVRSGLITRKIDVPREVRRNGDMGVVPRNARYTCSGKTLTIRQTVDQADLLSKTVWRLKRA
ncbi:hypothetical protein [Actinocorallia populi]|uniref:hypothetical protein n=1 Tax=Actinocorallia populi TaxID=2079200 RepID=UPI0013008525|nr:hypothetical protein [Actinocorallia populi]